VDWSMVDWSPMINLPPVEKTNPITPSSHFTTANVESSDDEQRGQTESLSRISQALDKMLQCTTTTWRQIDIDCCMFLPSSPHPCLYI
jgi:hypothetical protein